MAKKRLFKITVPHAADCGAVRMVSEGAWPSPWSWIAEGSEWHNTYGNACGTHGFLRFGCNDPRCPAKCIVRSELIDDMLAGAEAKS